MVCIVWPCDCTNAPPKNRTICPASKRIGVGPCALPLLLAHHTDKDRKSAAYMFGRTATFVLQQLPLSRALSQCPAAAAAVLRGRQLHSTVNCSAQPPASAAAPVPAAKLPAIPPVKRISRGRSDALGRHVRLNG
jgi:hypothetical protein